MTVPLSGGGRLARDPIIDRLFGFLVREHGFLYTEEDLSQGVTSWRFKKRWLEIVVSYEVTYEGPLSPTLQVYDGGQRVLDFDSESPPGGAQSAEAFALKLEAICRQLRAYIDGLSAASATAELFSIRP